MSIPTKRLDALDPTFSPERDHEVAAMRDGVTNKLRIEQILALLQTSDIPDAAVTLAKMAAEARDASNHTFDDTTAQLGETDVRGAIVEAYKRSRLTPGTASVNNLDDGVLPITPAMGRYITLEDHGAADFVIEGFGDDCPVGWTFTLVIPRTIGDTGGANNSLGNYVQFVHSTSGAGLDHEKIKQMDGTTVYRGYRAYPNATDAFGSAAALFEELTYQHLGSGRWALREVPSDLVGENANGEYERTSLGAQSAAKEITGLGPVTTSESGGFRLASETIDTGSWASGFLTRPKVSGSCGRSDGDDISFLMKTNGAVSATSSGGWNIWRLSSRSSTNFYIALSAQGRWKPLV